MEKIKVLVTGAAGFIGFHLIQKLLKDNYEVVGFDNINDYYDTSLKYDRLNQLGIIKENILPDALILGKPGFRFIKADLENSENLLNLFSNEKFDFVVHLAAQAGVRYSIENPTAYISSNIVGFFNVLEACRKYPVKHLVYASSSSVYGANKKIPFSTQDPVDNPISLYAATKKSNELMAYTYSHLFKIPSTGLRFFTVYGPWGRPDMAYFSFSEKIRNDKPIEIFNYGNMKRDFTYIDDIVEGIVRVINNIPEAILDGEQEKPAYRVYNIGNNAPVELKRFIEILENLLGKKSIQINKPMQMGDVPITYADIEDIRRDTGFQPVTTLETGLKNFVDWYLHWKK